MTREEAIEVITDYLNKDTAISPYNSRFIYALNIAREALQVEPNEVVEQEPKILDTIDFAIDASNGGTNYYVGFRNGLRYAKSLVDGAEPQFENCAEQEPKHGEWIVIDDTHSQCTECGAIFCITSSDEWGVNFCPTAERRWIRSERHDK